MSPINGTNGSVPCRADGRPLDNNHVQIGAVHPGTTTDCIMPYISDKTASPEVANALNTLPFERNIFKLMANADSFFVPFMNLLSTCWGPNREVRPSDWQLIVLRTAATLDAPYEWDVNEPVARIFGFTEEMLQGLKIGDLSDPDLFTDRMRLISKMVEELTDHHKVTEPTMEEAKSFLGTRATMEVIMIQGVYGLLARAMRSAKIDMDGPIEGLEAMLRKYNAKSVEIEMEVQRKEKEEREAKKAAA